RDVESMIRDLVEISINMVRSSERKKMEPRARELAEERLLDLLVPDTIARHRDESIVPLEAENSTREKFRKMLRAGELDDREVRVDTQDRPAANFEIFAVPGMEMDRNLRDMLSNMMPKRTRRRKLKVRDAR